MFMPKLPPLPPRSVALAGSGLDLDSLIEIGESAVVLEVGGRGPKTYRGSRHRLPSAPQLAWHRLDRHYRRPDVEIALGNGKLVRD